MAAHPADIVDSGADAGPRRWFKKDPALRRGDPAAVRARPSRRRARRIRRLDRDADGALALVLLLDQFPRNLYRGSAHAFATDPLARRSPREAIDAGHDRAVEPRLRSSSTCPSCIPRTWPTRTAAWPCARPRRRRRRRPGTLKWAPGPPRHHRPLRPLPAPQPRPGPPDHAEEQAFLDEGGFAG